MTDTEQTQQIASVRKAIETRSAITIPIEELFRVIAGLSLADHLGDTRDAERSLLDLLGLPTDWDGDVERISGSDIVVKALYGDD